MIQNINELNNYENEITLKYNKIKNRYNLK